MNQVIRRIGVFTSGGDSPGMNACIRAVVRTAIYHKLEVYGIRRGYEGMINGEMIPLEASSVANIIQRGGTFLKTARSMRFMTPEGRHKAYQQLKNHQIDALVAIGGDGTFRGAIEFCDTYDFPLIGLPGTIDNDLFGTDFTIGYDTAINTVVEAVDKIRDTAESHDRLFLVEVMGRDSGLIALRSGIGAGAEAIIIPESKSNLEHLYDRLEQGHREKASKIVIVAEGDEAGGAFGIARKVKERFPQYDAKVTVLGHIQRGGSPSCQDRVLASRLGFTAVEALIAGTRGVMIGMIHKDIVFTPLGKAIKHIEEINPNLIRMVEILST